MGAIAFVLAPNLLLADGPSPLMGREDLTEADRQRVAKVTALTQDFSKAEAFENMQGGAGTSTKTVNHNAFSHPSANLSFEDQHEFILGNALFRKIWVTPPASAGASDGLGPLFNSRSCQSCHLKDGRGHPPEGDPDATSMFLRLARPISLTLAQDNKDAPARKWGQDPVYGSQFQDLAVPGLRPEGRMVIIYHEQAVTLGDGTVVSLRRPEYKVTDLGYGPLHPDTVLSPRIAPPMIGQGLVEAIHPADILRKADPNDEDGDGISGRAAMVEERATRKKALGFFGWKAENPSVREQSAEAFAGDIGMSSPDLPLHHGDCTEHQTDCLALPTGVQENLGDTEGPDPVMELLAFYSRNLAVPARRKVNHPQTLRGKAMFYGIGCVSCHTPKYVTRRDSKHDAQSFQLIWPYSDFLLHDMGDGLADGQVAGAANGREWKTPPLWGIGLTETVSGHTFFLHDGRARNLAEAILWHGGEAQASRDKFAMLGAKDRKALLSFLESL